MATRLKLNNKETRSGKVKSRMQIVEENRKKKKLTSVQAAASTNARKAVSALRKKRVLKKLAKVGLVIASILFVMMFAVGIYAFSYLQKLNDELPSPDEPFGEPPVASIIYDRNAINGEGQGTQLYKIIGDFNSDPVDIDEIPELVKWTFLAAEDIDFYNHNGFDTKGIIRCAIKNLSSESVCGGSTITQQLLKITALKDEKSKVERKIKELLMATKVEQLYTKDEILQMYLSVTPYGSNIVGIETASKFYFGKEPKDLKLEEAAILASIVQNPSYLSPTKPIDGDTTVSQAAVKERQEISVLNQMIKYKDKINDQHRKNIDDKEAEDLITEEMIEEAKEAELKYVPPIATDIKAGHFVDYVQDLLTTRNYKNGEEPFTLSELQNNGYKIYTTLDYEQQKIAEEYAARGGSLYPHWNAYNAAIMTLDPRNGQILTMAGSKSYFGQSEGCNAEGIECKYDPQVNVLNSLNEPGSTAKVLAYTLAFDEGKLFGGSNLPDIPITYGEIGYTPKNWDGSYIGPTLTARNALVQSRNIPALEVIELIGVEKYIATAEQLGYTSFDRSQVGPSVVLGGASVRYIEHVGAFASFANGGNYIPVNPILKIEDRNGKVIYEATVNKTQVISPQAVHMTNEILYNLQNIANAAGVPLVSKTGTTEGNTEALQLAWNSNQVTIGWVGNNNNDPLDPYYGYPIYMVQPWLAEYISRISSVNYYKDKNPGFERPGFVYVGGGSCNEKGECLGLEPDWLIQGKNPPGNKKMEKAKVCVDQQNKLAREIDILTGNAVDKEFTRLTMPVERWQSILDTAMGGNNGAPKEYCTIDRTGGATGPFFNITAPKQSSTVGNTFNVAGGVFTTNGNITSASILFDDQVVGSISQFNSFNQSVDVSSLGLPDGTYQLKIRATDSNGITNDSNPITVVLGSAVNSNFTFVLPPSPSDYSGFINITVNTTIGMTNVRLKAIKNGGATIDLGTMNSVPGGYQKNIGPVINNENATYVFYVTGNAGNTGSIQSIQSGQLQINQK